MHFTILGAIEREETIAEGRGIRELSRLVKAYGAGNWRKRKGTLKFAWRMAGWGAPSYIGMKRMASVGANSN